MSENTDVCATRNALFVGPPPVVVPVEVALRVATAPRSLPPLLVAASICSLKQAATDWEELVAAHPGKRGNGERRRNAKAARRLAHDAQRALGYVDLHPEIVAFTDAPTVTELDLAQWDVLARLAPTWQHDFTSMVATAQTILPAAGSGLAVDLRPFVDWQSRDLLSTYVHRLRVRLPSMARDVELEEQHRDYLTRALRESTNRSQQYQRELEEARRVHRAIEDLWHGEPETLRGMFADLNPRFF